MNKRIIQIGDTVRVIGTGQVGIVVGKGKYIVVRFGQIRINAALLNDDVSFARTDLLLVS